MRKVFWFLLLAGFLMCVTDPCAYPEGKGELSIPEITLIGEAEGEGFIGKLAVAEVIRNRMRERKMSADRVCLQPYQFTCWNDPRWAMMKAYDRTVRSDEETFWQHSQAWQAWEVSGRPHKSVVGKANLYHTKDVKPIWSVSPKVKYITTVGNHMFYYEKRG